MASLAHFIPSITHYEHQSIPLVFFIICFMSCSSEQNTQLSWRICLDEMQALPVTSSHIWALISPTDSSIGPFKANHASPIGVHLADTLIWSQSAWPTGFVQFEDFSHPDTCSWFLTILQPPSAQYSETITKNQHPDSDGQFLSIRYASCQ